MTTETPITVPADPSWARPLARRVGLIILATDQTSEPDFRRMADRAGRIGVLCDPRTPMPTRRRPTICAHAADADATAPALILPGELRRRSAIACTAASAVIGEAEVAAAINGPSPACRW